MSRVVAKIGSGGGGGGGQASWFGGSGAGKDLEGAARRISGELFQAGDENHDGSISPAEFRATIGPRLFESVGGVLPNVPMWAPAGDPAERDFATVLAERRAAQERERRCVARTAARHLRVHRTIRPSRT